MMFMQISSLNRYKVELYLDAFKTFKNDILYTSALPKVGEFGHGQVVPQHCAEVLELPDPLSPLAQRHSRRCQEGRARWVPAPARFTAAQNPQHAPGPHGSAQHAGTLRNEPKTTTHFYSKCSRGFLKRPDDSRAHAPYQRAPAAIGSSSSSLPQDSEGSI